MHTKEELIRDFQKLGLQAGDTVFMHSSFKSLGGVEGGAQTVFDALQAVLTQEGTLVLPAFSYRTVGKQDPVFSVRDTPCCVGYLPEYFRTQVPGVLRSIHPTHSCCAWGKHAAALLQGHIYDDTPVGKHSPLYLLRQYGGKILFLGCGVECNTTLHGVEEEMQVPYVFSPKEKWDYTVHTLDGRTYSIHHYRHQHIIGQTEYCQNFTRLFTVLSPAQYAVGPVGAATAYLIPSQTVWETGRAQVEKDPFFFVTPRALTQ